MSIQYVFVVLNLYIGNLNKTEKAYITKVANFFCDAIKRQSCHHIETSQLICSANQLTGFYMMATLALNELN